MQLGRRAHAYTGSPAEQAAFDVIATDSTLKPFEGQLEGAVHGDYVKGVCCVHLV